MQTQNTLRSLDITPMEVAELRFHAAICYLEEAKPKMARTFFEQVLKICPTSPMRPLTLFYLEQIDGKQFEIDELTDEWIALAPTPDDATANDTDKKEEPTEKKQDAADESAGSDKPSGENNDGDKNPPSESEDESESPEAKTDENAEEKKKPVDGAAKKDNS